MVNDREVYEMKEIADCSVLVVDDNEANVDILVDTLGEIYEVSVAMDGPTALEVVKENPPDLILLDIMMPGMDGYEVCQRLKANQKTRSIPVIFVTAMDQIADEMKGFALGAVDYITKPISPPVVKARVETHLRLRNSERHLKELLEKTLGGTVKMLTEMLSIANPAAFSRASRITRHVKNMADSRNIGHVWQIRMAAMLSQIGWMTLSPDTMCKIHQGEQMSREEEEAFDRHVQVGYELISQIPNLREVAEIIVRQQDLEWKGQSEERPTKLILQGSQMLKLAVDYEKLLAAGKSGSEAMAVLRSDKNAYGGELFSAFSSTVEADDDSSPIRHMNARELSPGMLINKDILTKEGKLLAAAGTEVTLPVVETLYNFAKTGFVAEPFEVLVPKK
jgi:putative two-component system response regulator